MELIRTKLDSIFFSFFKLFMALVNAVLRRVVCEQLVKWIVI